MTPIKQESGDDRNASFGAPERVVDHKPGFDFSPATQGVEDGKDHRRRPKDAKDIPQTPLAKRLRHVPKG
jgi:hypothetical protein